MGNEIIQKMQKHMCPILWRHVLKLVQIKYWKTEISLENRFGPVYTGFTQIIRKLHNKQKSGILILCRHFQKPHLIVDSDWLLKEVEASLL